MKIEQQIEKVKMKIEQQIEKVIENRRNKSLSNLFGILALASMALLAALIGASGNKRLVACFLILLLCWGGWEYFMSKVEDE